MLLQTHIVALVLNLVIKQVRWLLNRKNSHKMVKVVEFSQPQSKATPEP